MVVVEPSFPRGGTFIPERNETTSKVHFGATQKKTKSLRKERKVSSKDDKPDEKLEAVSAELLSHKTVQEGMVIMGRIRAVDSTQLKISLPGRIVGNVLASAISQSYTNVLSKYVESGEIRDEFKTLSDMFHVGQLVYTKVVEIYNGENNKLNISLSLMPADVHYNMYHMNLSKGMIFYGAVQEIQEHGYVMETGIKNLRCFIPTEKQQQQYSIGELVYMKIDNVTTTKSASTIICKDIQNGSKKIKDLDEPKLDYIVPTTVMSFTVTKILKDGLQGTLMNGKFTAYINEHHLEKPFSVPSDYKVSASYNARLMYVMPLTKLVYLSLNFDEYSDEDVSLHRGEIVDTAIVHHVGTGGIVFQLPDELKGLLSFKSIKANYFGNYDQDEMLAKYKLGTTHRLRIIEHDPIDNLFICSDNPRVVNEKFYTISDLNPGDFVTATVVEKQNSNIYLVTVGNVRGLIEEMFMEMSTRNLKPDHKLRCRVMSINPQRKIIYLTNRSEYMDNDVPLLLNLSEAKENKIFCGTVVKSYDSYFLVKFFNELKGVLYKSSLNKFGFDESLTFYEGQTANFRISQKKEAKIILDVISSKFNVGKIYKGTVTNIVQNGLDVVIDDEVNAKGFVPIRLLSDFPDLVPVHLRTYKLQEQLNLACVLNNIFSVRDTEYFSEKPVKSWKELEFGEILRAYIKNVHEDIIELLIPLKGYKKLVKVHLKMFVNYTLPDRSITVVPDQVVFVKLLSKEAMTKTITVTAKLTDIWNGDLKTTAAWVGKYLQELDKIQKCLEEQQKPIGSYVLGQKVTGTLIERNEETKEWTVELSNGVAGLIKSFFTVKDKSLKRGQQIEAVVIWIDYISGIVYLSQSKNDINRISDSKELPKRFKHTTGVKARILHICNDVIVCSIKKGTNPLIIVPTRVHNNDFTRSVAVGISEGEFCRLSFIHDVYPIAVFDKLKVLWNHIEQMNKKHSNNAELAAKRAKLMEGSHKHEPKFTIRRPYEFLIKNMKSKKQENSPYFFTDTKGHGVKRKVKEEKVETPNEHQCEENTTNKGFETNKKKRRKDTNQADLPSEDIKMEEEPDTVQPVLPGATDFWSTYAQVEEVIKKESSDEEDESEVKPKKKKKLTPAEKFQAAREEEARLREIEESYVKGEVQTADQFDRLVLSNPNNSITWINYMVFHLQATEIDKARNVARRALKAINFREEDELLNIWVALLNLELRYGTNESFNETLKEALFCSDQYKIYSRSLEILAEAKKEREVDEMATKVMKKFKENPDIYKIAATAYFKVGLSGKVQQLLPKALHILPEKEHVNLIASFANLNHKFNDKESAYSLLENVVVSYPKRVDVWSSYVDMLVKDNLIDSARTVLDRAITHKIALKKMRTLFKKYLEFEEKYGNQENIDKVKALASEYVKNAVESQ